MSRRRVESEDYRSFSGSDTENMSPNRAATQHKSPRRRAQSESSYGSRSRSPIEGRSHAGPSTVGSKSSPGRRYASASASDSEGSWTPVSQRKPNKTASPLKSSLKRGTATQSEVTGGFTAATSEYDDRRRPSRSPSGYSDSSRSKNRHASSDNGQRRRARRHDASSVSSESSRSSHDRHVLRRHETYSSSPGRRGGSVTGTEASVSDRRLGRGVVSRPLSRDEQFALAQHPSCSGGLKQALKSMMGAPGQRGPPRHAAAPKGLAVPPPIVTRLDKRAPRAPMSTASVSYDGSIVSRDYSKGNRYRGRARRQSDFTRSEHTSHSSSCSCSCASASESPDRSRARPLRRGKRTESSSDSAGWSTGSSSSPSRVRKPKVLNNKSPWTSSADSSTLLRDTRPRFSVVMASDDEDEFDESVSRPGGFKKLLQTKTARKPFAAATGNSAVDAETTTGTEVSEQPSRIHRLAQIAQALDRTGRASIRDLTRAIKMKNQAFNAKLQQELNTYGLTPPGAPAYQGNVAPSNPQQLLPPWQQQQTMTMNGQQLSLPLLPPPTVVQPPMLPAASPITPRWGAPSASGQQLQPMFQPQFQPPSAGLVSSPQHPGAVPDHARAMGPVVPATEPAGTPAPVEQLVVPPTAAARPGPLRANVSRPVMGGSRQPFQRPVHRSLSPHASVPVAPPRPPPGKPAQTAQAKTMISHMEGELRYLRGIVRALTRTKPALAHRERWNETLPDNVASTIGHAKPAGGKKKGKKARKGRWRAVTRAPAVLKSAVDQLNMSVATAADRTRAKSAAPKLNAFSVTGNGLLDPTSMVKTVTDYVQRPSAPMFPGFQAANVQRATTIASPSAQKPVPKAVVVENKIARAMDASLETVGRMTFVSLQPRESMTTPAVQSVPSQQSSQPQSQPQHVSFPAPPSVPPPLSPQAAALPPSSASFTLSQAPVSVPKVVLNSGPVVMPSLPKTMVPGHTPVLVSSPLRPPSAVASNRPSPVSVPSGIVASTTLSSGRPPIAPGPPSMVVHMVPFAEPGSPNDRNPMVSQDASLRTLSTAASQSFAVSTAIQSKASPVRKELPMDTDSDEDPWDNVQVQADVYSVKKPLLPSPNLRISTV